jgi:hypothetical protein
MRNLIGQYSPPQNPLLDGIELDPFKRQAVNSLLASLHFTPFVPRTPTKPPEKHSTPKSMARNVVLGAQNGLADMAELAAFLPANPTQPDAPDPTAMDRWPWNPKAPNPREGFNELASNITGITEKNTPSNGSLDDAARVAGGLLPSMIGGWEGLAVKGGTKGAPKIAPEVAAIVRRLLTGQAKALPREEAIAFYMSKGYSREAAEYLMEPYIGQGSHYWPVRGIKLPFTDYRLKLHPLVRDSMFNVSKPRNMTRGEFYKYHFEVDPKMFGAKMKEVGRGTGWSGRRLGFDKRGLFGQAWYGAPTPLKLFVGGGGLGAGTEIYRENREEE